MRTRARTRLTLAGMFLFSISCGGGGGPIAPGPGEQPEQPSEGPVLTYVPIAGEWIGKIKEETPEFSETSWAELELEESATEGERVGRVVYSYELGAPVCTCELAAVDVEGTTYVVDEVNCGRNCASGIIELIHREETDQLTFEWTGHEPGFTDWEAFGTLERK